MTQNSPSVMYHERARTFGLCGRHAPDGPQVCNLHFCHAGPHRWQDNGWNLCKCGHAIVEHRAGRRPCCFCDCPEPMTADTPSALREKTK